MNLSIHIVDRKTNLIKDYLTNKQDKKVVFEDKHVRNIQNNTETYDFIVDYVAGENIQVRDRVIIPDEVKGQYREFIVSDTDTDTFDGETEVRTVASYLEDLEKAKPFEPQKLEKYTASQAVEFAIQHTGWEAGEIEFGGVRSLSWTSYNNPFQVLKMIANRFELQLDFTIEVGSNKVERRLVHLRERKALFNGKEITRGKDLDNLVVKRSSTDIVTALLAVAPEPQGEGKERVTTVVVDDEAQAELGKPKDYIWGLYEPQSDDTDMTLKRLTTLATTELNKRKQPTIDYDIDAVDLEEFLSHEQVRIGDKVRIKDDEQEPTFYADATVKEVSRSIFNKLDKKYVLGEIVEYKKEDITKLFNKLKSQISERLKNTNSNLDNIVTKIDEEVERRIYKQDTPPDNPINDQLWLDTSVPGKPILKRYFNGNWNVEIKAVTEPSDIDAVSREQAMYEAALSSFANLVVTHEQLLVEAAKVKLNKYLTESHISNIDTQLQSVINTYNSLKTTLDSHKESASITLEESNNVHQLMLNYSSSVSQLRTVLHESTKYAADRLEFLQSQYTEEKYNDVLNEIANKFGLVNQDGVLKGDAALAKDLEQAKKDLEKQIEDTKNNLNDMIDSITGDNRNLIVGTSLIDESHFSVQGGHTVLGDESIEYVRLHAEAVNEAFIHFNNKVDYKLNETYTLALDFRSTVVDELDYIFLTNDSTTHILHDSLTPAPLELSTDGEWHRYNLEFTPTSNIEGAQLKVGTDFTNDAVGEFDLRQIHLFKGTGEIAWQPAPEDNRQFITQLSREITDLESKVAQKLTRADYDILEKSITNVSTEVSQTADVLVNKADKSVVDTINNTVKNHSATISQHAEGLDKLYTATESNEGKITNVTNTANETAEGLAQNITKVTEIDGEVKKAQADIVKNTNEISNKLSTSEYNTDKNDIVSRLDASDSERTQLSNQIKDKVELTEYESYKVETGTLGDAHRNLYIDYANKGKWLRLARNGNANGTGGSRAFGRFIIADKTSSQHGVAEFTAGVHYNRRDNAEFTLNSFSKYSSFPFTKVRIGTKGTYDAQYIDVYFDPTRDATNSISIWLKDNIQTSGWTLLNLEEPTLVEDYEFLEYDLDEKASTKGILTTHETSLIQNGKDIALKADKTELDSVNETLTNQYGELKVASDKITGEVSGLSDDLKEVSTLATQTKDSYDISVRENTNKFNSITSELAETVKSDKVVASINASREGVKIKGDLVDISAGTNIRLAIDGAENRAKSHADSKASTAESNSKKYTDKEIDNIEIGGKNLIPDSNDFSNYRGYSGTTREYETGIRVSEWSTNEATRLKFQNPNNRLYTTPQIYALPSSIVTFSYWIKNIGDNPLKANYNGLSIIERNDSQELQPNEAKRVIVTGKLRSNYDWFQHQFRPVNDGDAIEFVIYRAQLEYGNKATDWTPAPEDITTLIEQTRASLDENAEAYAQAKAQAAENAAKAHADGVLSTEEKARIAADEANLKVLRQEQTNLENRVKAYSDGLVTAEEQARIAADDAKLKEAKAAATLAETQAKAYADGKVTAEEKRAIQDAKDKLAEAKEYAQSQATAAENAARTYALSKATTAEKAAKTYAASKAAAEREVAKAYADGEITKEEKARIAESKAKLAEAKTHASNASAAAESAAKTYASTLASSAESAAKTYALAQAKAERVKAEAYADGKVTDEERARINDAKAKLKEAKEHADNKAQAAEKAAKAVANTAQSTANTANSKADGAQSTANSAMSKANTADGKAESANSKIDNLELGGRNLLLKSGVPIATSNYNIQDYYLSEDIPEGTEVTVSFKAKLATGKSYFRLYNSGGTVSIGKNFYPSNAGGYEVFTHTFNWRIGSSSNKFLRVYHMPSSTRAESSIQWIKLERGNKATDWDLAPEDIVEKDNLITEINLSKHKAKIQAKQIDLVGDVDILNGLTRVKRLDAEAIKSGTIKSSNNLTKWNLNTGQLSMDRADITLGGGADLKFENVDNRLYYSQYDSQTNYTRTAGVGVGRSINDRLPYAFLGTTGTSRSNFDPKDENWFTGFITNTNRRMSEDEIGNSVVGKIFHVRDTATNYDKGFVFDLRGRTVEMRGINSGSYTYNIGNENNSINNIHLHKIKSNNGYIRLQNTSSNSDYDAQGFTAETQYNGDSYLHFRGTHSSHYHALGKPGWRFSRVYLHYSPDVSSDARLKENIHHNHLGLDFINDVETKTFRFKHTNPHKEQESDQYGIIAQQLKRALEKHNVDTSNLSMLSMGEDGYWGVQLEQLTIPAIKAIQELSEKQKETERKNIELTSKVDVLEQKNKELEEKLNQILNMLGTSES